MSFTAIAGVAWHKLMNAQKRTLIGVTSRVRRDVPGAVAAAGPCEALAEDATRFGAGVLEAAAAAGPYEALEEDAALLGAGKGT